MTRAEELTAALAPCPFCGGEAEILHLDEGENAGGSCVGCTQCLASSNVEFEFKENFVARWNNRVTLPRDDLREALEAARPYVVHAAYRSPDAQKVRAQIDAALSTPGKYSAEVRAAPSLPPSPPDGTVGEMLAELPDAETLRQMRHSEYVKDIETATARAVAVDGALRLAAHLRSQAGTVGFYDPTSQPYDEPFRHVDRPATFSVNRAEVIRLIRSEFDPTPPNWEGREQWNDNAEDVADRIASLIEETGVHASTAFRVLKKWLDDYAEEERAVSRYADHVMLDGTMTAAQRRAISAALAAAPARGRSDG